MHKNKILAAMAVVVAMAVALGIYFLTEKQPQNFLYIYTWADYISPDVVAQFENENSCRVVIDTFEDNETMLAKMVAGKSGYDIIFPSSYITPVMKRQGLIQKLDMNRLTNVIANLDRKYEGLLHEDSLVYSVPYAFSITGIAYRKDKVDETRLAHSWSDLMNPMFSGRVCMMRDMREVLGMGLRMQGASINCIDETVLSAACNYAVEVKRAAKCLDNEAYKPGLLSGDFYAAMGYNSDILQILDENEDAEIEFYIPKEGTTCCWDEMVINTHSRNVDLAYRFINFLYDGQVAAVNMKMVCSTMPNKAMFKYLDEEDKKNPYINPTPELLAAGELIKDVGENISKFQKAWDRFTSARTK